MAPLTRCFDSWKPIAALGLAMALGSLPSKGADALLEYQVKAVFLLNFTKFIEWPTMVFESPNSPVAICILGEDPFGTTLDQVVSGEVVNGRKVVVERIKRTPEPKSCQVLFWSHPEGEVAKTLSGFGPGVLTVGEGDSFLREGGMISFVIDNRRVRFDIHQTAAENARLKLSSRLLSVARLVAK
jgi:hypothetical protein